MPEKAKAPIPPPVDLPPVEEFPFYWFALLEQQMASNDVAGAAQSQRQLRRLGVELRLTPKYRPQRRERAVRHA